MSTEARVNGPLQNFVSCCTNTFKLFEHETNLALSRSTLWHFTSRYKRTGHHYAIFCAPQMKKSRNLIKLAHRKIPEDHRLIVICDSFSESDRHLADELDFCLMTFGLLNEFGRDMAAARQREEEMNLLANGMAIDSEAMQEDFSQVIEDIIHLSNNQ